MVWLAGALSLLCIARCEHVWASNVWIFLSGEDFKARQQDKERQKGKMLRAAKLPVHWKATRLTPEERWSLYRATGGGRLPWLFFGIRSHRLLVRARRGPVWVKLALTITRLAWLNWSFPVWTSIVLLVLALHGRSVSMRTTITIGVTALLLNTLGTLVGGAVAAITMGGFSRHHDNVPTKDEALNNAVVELGYGLVTAIIYVLTGAVFVQAMALLHGTGPMTITVDSLSTSVQLAVKGPDGPALGFGPTWLSVLNLAPFAFPGLAGVATGVTSLSAAKMWKVG